MRLSLKLFFAITVLVSSIITTSAQFSRQALPTCPQRFIKRCNGPFCRGINSWPKSAYPISKRVEDRHSIIQENNGYFFSQFGFKLAETNSFYIQSDHKESDLFFYVVYSNGKSQDVYEYTVNRGVTECFNRVPDPWKADQVHEFRLYKVQSEKRRDDE